MTTPEPRFFWRWTEQPGREVFSDVVAQFERCSLLVRVFYCFLLYSSMLLYPTWQSLIGRSEPDLLWPVAWAAHVPWELAVKVILLASILSGFAAAIRPRLRIARIAAFVGFLMAVALHNSYGKINHNYHPLLFVALVFIFLPSSSPSKEPTADRKRRYCEAFWGAQALVLSMYSLAGFMKIAGAGINVLRGEKTVFHLEGPAMTLALDFIRRETETMFGRFVLENYVLLAYPLFVAAVYLELFALAAAFRPALHRFWGGGLIAMHLGISLVMEIHFDQGIFLLGLLFLASPFAGPSTGLAPPLRDLPLLGPFLAAIGRRVARPEASS